MQMGPLIQMRVEFKNVWYGSGILQENEKRMRYQASSDRFQERDDQRDELLYVEQEASKGLKQTTVSKYAVIQHNCNFVHACMLSPVGTGLSVHDSSGKNTGGCYFLLRIFHPKDRTHVSCIGHQGTSSNAFRAFIYKSQDMLISASIQMNGSRRYGIYTIEY